jgi:hypothetical protein
MAKPHPDAEEETGIPYARTDDPVKVDGPSPSENSRLRAATAIQSSVDPDSYPEDARDQQVAAATGKGPKPHRKPAN